MFTSSQLVVQKTRRRWTERKYVICAVVHALDINCSGKCARLISNRHIDEKRVSGKSGFLGFFNAARGLVADSLVSSQANQHK